MSIRCLSSLCALTEFFMFSLSPSRVASLIESHPWNVCLWARCQFSTFEQCQDWLKRLNNAIRPPSKIEDLFSFAYHAWCMEVYASEKEQHGDLCRPGTWEQPWEHQSSTWKSPRNYWSGFDSVSVEPTAFCSPQQQLSV